MNFLNIHFFFFVLVYSTGLISIYIQTKPQEKNSFLDLPIEDRSGISRMIKNIDTINNFIYPPEASLIRGKLFPDRYLLPMTAD